MSTDQNGRNRDDRAQRARTGRDRRHLCPGRARAVNARFTDDEYAELVTAADLAGLTPTGFCAQAALDTAYAVNTLIERAEYQALGALQAELFQARVTINQLRGAVSGHLDSGSTADHDEIIARARRTVAGVDDVISRIHRLIGERLAR
jgi:uncharacterized protein (DUF1778 family)